MATLARLTGAAAGRHCAFAARPPARPSALPRRGLPWQRGVWRPNGAGIQVRRPLATVAAAAPAPPPDRLTIGRPDDFHLHLRDTAQLRAVMPHTAAAFARGLVMPNLRPPVTTTQAALAYRGRILDAVPCDSDFSPLMALYLTDSTPASEVAAAKASGRVLAFKLYPAGATTNSAEGVTSLDKCQAALDAMEELGMPLCVHGEVTSPGVDVFDREAAFIDAVLAPLVARRPKLRVVMEHITTAQAAAFVTTAPATVAATITPQHLLWSRNELFRGGLRPHAYCLPVLKRESHRLALLAAVATGSPKFFLGTDSAPHTASAKESACGCAGVYSAPVALPLYAAAFESVGALRHLEGFASRHGANFYGLPRNAGTVSLVRRPWVVPASYEFGDERIVPMMAGQEIAWAVEGSSQEGA